MIKLNNQNGAVLISILITLPFLILIAFNYTLLGVNNYTLARQDQSLTNAQFAADAGADFGLNQINKDNSWVGSAAEVELQNVSGLRTTYTSSVSTLSSTRKLLTSIGKSYRTGDPNPKSTITVNVELRAVQSGDYSVVTGVGGLFLSNSAKIMGGNVYVNGEIRMSNTAQIGLSTNPVNVSVAHQICPVPSNPQYNAQYPRVCNPNENGQPIQITNSAKIYGNTRANNQSTTTGLLSPGLTASTGVAALPLPTHDRVAQKNAVPPANTNPQNNLTGAAASCSSGTKSWPANTKITGNVSVTNSCKVTVEGDVWITGTFTVRNSGEIIVSNSLGNTRPNIMVDGNKAEFGNSGTLRSNINNTGFQILNYWSKDTCSPECTNVTGAALADSRDEITIDLSNSASGPHTIFYSRWTQVNVNNSGQIGSLIGQTVNLSNSSTITFGTSTGLGSTFWIADGYRRVY